MTSHAAYGQHAGLLSPWVDSMRVKKIASHITVGDRVLDIGCGSALLLKALPPGCDYVGIDQDRRVLEANRQQLSHVRFFAADVVKDPLPFVDETFDVAVMGAFLEHVDETFFLFREVRRVLRKSGHVLATTPSKMGGFLHHVLADVGLLSHEAAEEHKDFWNRETMGKRLRDTGLALKHYESFQYGLNQLYILSREEQ
jgi:SAM-dependent methyltransferase